MIISTLFAALGLLTGGQVVQDIPLQEIQQTADFTRYKFEHYDNRHIVDLNRDNEIVAYYINNNLQNRFFLYTDNYAKQVKKDLVHQFSYNEDDFEIATTQHAGLGARTLTGRDTGRLGYDRSETYISTPRSQLDWEFREYNHPTAEYYSRDGRCYQRGGRRKRNWFLWHKWTSFVRSGGVTELNPISNHCPNNKRYVERNRDDPSLFFDDDYIALDDSGLNFKTTDGWDQRWYLTDEYIASGMWMEHDDLAALMLFYNAFQIIDFLEFSEYAENIAADTDSAIREGAKEKIQVAITEGIFTESARQFVKKSLPKIASTVNIVVTIATIIHTVYSEIRAAVQMSALLTTSKWGKGWILTRTNAFNWSWLNLSTHTAPRSW